MNTLLRWAFISLLGIFPELVYAAEGGESAGAVMTEGSPAQAIVLSSEAISAIQQERQQLVAQFAQQLAAASPDVRLVLVGDFRQQLSGLLAPLQPTALIVEQQAQPTVQPPASQQLFMLSQPIEFQQEYAVLLQRQELIQQMATASTAEERLAFVGQIRQANTSLPAPAKIVEQSPTTETERAQAQAAWVATLPPELQAEIQAREQRQQTIQAALQLSPDERSAALNVIQAQAPTLTLENGSTISNPIDTSSVTQP